MKETCEKILINSFLAPIYRCCLHSNALNLAFFQFTKIYFLSSSLITEKEKSKTLK